MDVNLYWITQRREKTARIRLRRQALQWSIGEDVQDSESDAGVRGGTFSVWEGAIDK